MIHTGSKESVITSETIPESPKLKVFSLNTYHAGRAMGLENEILDLIHAEQPGLLLLQKKPVDIFAGDLNTPRGNYIFNSLSERFDDNIPPYVTTTLDSGVKPSITWEYVIDGFFTSKHCHVPDIRLIQGLSDHKGIMAEVQRVAS